MVRPCGARGGSQPPVRWHCQNLGRHLSTPVHKKVDSAAPHRAAAPTTTDHRPRRNWTAPRKTLASMQAYPVDDHGGDNFADFGAKYKPASSTAELQHEHDAALLGSLLDSVSASITTFRPSPSLADLPSGGLCKEEVDVVISGGGLKGYFVIGARKVLETQFECKLKVARYAARPQGMGRNVHGRWGVTSDWLKTYTRTRAAFNSGDSTASLRPIASRLCAPNPSSPAPCGVALPTSRVVPHTVPACLHTLAAAVACEAASARRVPPMQRLLHLRHRPR